MYFNARPLDNTSTAQINFFRQTNTSGEISFNIFEGDNTADIQHRFRADTGDADLCQQAGQLTVGGTGGTQKLTVVGGAVGIENGYKYTAKNTGGTYVDCLGVEAGGYRLLVGATGARTKLRSNDSCLFPVPTSAVSDANHDASTWTVWVDETLDEINFKVKDSGSTVNTAQLPLTPEERLFCAYDGAGGTTIATSYTDIPWDNQITAGDDYTHSTTINPAEITINTAGWYELTFEASADSADGTNRHQVTWRVARDTGGGYAVAAGTYAGSYHRVTARGLNTATITRLYNFGAGDKVKLQGLSTHATNVTTYAGGSRVIIKRLT